MFGRRVFGSKVWRVLVDIIDLLSLEEMTTNIQPHTPGRVQATNRGMQLVKNFLRSACRSKTSILQLNMYMKGDVYLHKGIRMTVV